MPIVPPLAASQVVIVTTRDTNSNGKAGLMTTLGFVKKNLQVCISHELHYVYITVDIVCKQA